MQDPDVWREIKSKEFTQLMKEQEINRMDDLRK